MWFNKSNYLTKINYVTLYIIFLFFWYEVSKIQSIYYTLYVFLLFSYFLYISYKRIQYLKLKDKIKRRLFLFLILPFIFTIIQIIYIYFFRKIDSLFIYIYWVIYIIHFLAIVKITFTQIDNKKSNFFKTFNLDWENYKTWKYFIFYLILVAIIMQLNHIITYRYSKFLWKGYYYIKNWWVEFFSLLAILGFIIFKTNVFNILKNYKVFYYIFLPFRIIILLIKKYPIIFFRKIINFVKNLFIKLEKIEKDLNKK